MGAASPHPFGQGYTVWVRCGRARSVRAGYGPVGSGGRGVTRSVMASRVKTVGARSGLDGFVELGRGTGMARFG